jgi:hypothetical protein
MMKLNLKQVLAGLITLSFVAISLTAFACNKGAQSSSGQTPIEQRNTNPQT